MIVNLNRDQIDWLQENSFFKELSSEQQSELDDSIPESLPIPNSADDRVEWQCPACASVLVRDRFNEFYEEQKRLIGEMNRGIVTGSMNLNILGANVN